MQGCSSLDGWTYEHGPFRVLPDGSALERFEYTWASVANMVYLEAPVGVGFSYSDNPKQDYKCNDDNTALDNLAAVEKFYELFPELKTLPNGEDRPLFLTGESYGTWAMMEGRCSAECHSFPTAFIFNSWGLCPHIGRSHC